MSAIKATWLATAVVLTAMTLVGVSPAAAESTLLCKANEEHCSSENIWPLSFEEFDGVIGEAPSEVAELAMGTFFFTITCDTGKLYSSLEETEGPLIGEVTKWNFLGCTPKPCTLAVPKEFETGYSAEVTATGGGDGILEVGSTPTLIATCPKAFTCVYSTPTMSLQVEGSPGEGEEGHIFVEEVLTKDALESTLGCPKTATYTALYWIAEPGTPTYVTN